MANSRERSGKASGHPVCAQAWMNGSLIAESDAAMTLEDGTHPARLCFPRSDVRAGPDALLELTSAGAPEGYVAFDSDHERLRLQIADDLGVAPGRTEPDRLFKRFPAWGDVTDLIDLLNVQPAGEGRYVSVTRQGGAQVHRGVVEGSQLLAQSIVAAGREAEGRRAVHASMVFLKAASSAEPLQFQLETQSAGRTFTTLGVKVRQGDKLCASGLLLLDVTAPDVMRHGVAAPETPGPYQSVPRDMSVTGRDVRFVDGAYSNDPAAPVGPPVIDAWLRHRQLPDNPYLHAGLLAHFTGHVSVAAAMRPHAGIGQSQAHRTLSTAINAITLSLHGPILADHWMLYRHHSTFAGSGMTHAECRVHNLSGALLASFTVDAMVRGFAPRHAVSERSSL